MSDPPQTQPIESAEVVAPDSVTPSVVPATGEGEGQESQIESPAKVIRLGSMVKQLLEEVRTTTLDEAARGRLRSIYDSTVDELRESLPGELGEELDRIAPDFDGAAVPTEGELRIAQAQLVGWLEGLFHGIQATLVAQQMAARQQLEGMRHQLPQGPPGTPERPGTYL